MAQLSVEDYYARIESNSLRNYRQRELFVGSGERLEIFEDDRYPFNEINFAESYREFPYDFVAEGSTGSEAITGDQKGPYSEGCTSLRRQRVR